MVVEPSFADISQLVENRFHKSVVTGSSPVISTRRGKSFGPDRKLRLITTIEGRLIPALWIAMGWL